MRAVETLILVLLSSPCRSNLDEAADPDGIEASYDLGDGSGDGACEQDYQLQGLSVYDPYPGDHTDYPMMDVAAHPTAFPGDDFEGYANNALIASGSSGHDYIDVTSGALYAKHLQGSQLWKRGYTTTHNFRMLAVGSYGGLPIRYRDGLASLRVYFGREQAGAPHYTGAHLFQRYQTEYDLYVAGLRLDGQVMIKKKHCGVYTTLAVADYSGGAVETGVWYELEFEARGEELFLYVDGQLELTATDDSLSWGSTGVRLDYVDAYVDDWFYWE